MFNLWDTIKTKIAGGSGNIDPVHKEKLDFDFESDYEKLKTLLTFTTKLHENAEGVKELLIKQNENTRNIGVTMGNLQTSIRELEDVNNELDTEANFHDTQEEEKKVDFNSTFGKGVKESRLKDSNEMLETETTNNKLVNDCLIEMEDGIDILKSAIDAIERRKRCRKTLEVIREELNQLNGISDEPDREKTIKEAKRKSLEKDITKINGNLREEVTKAINSIERKAQTYLSKLVRVRKSHLSNQKEQWSKVARKYLPDENWKRSTGSSLVE